MSEIGVGLVGYKFMGRAHSNAYRQVAHFFDVDPAPRMVAICGRDEAGGARPPPAQLGWEGYETDYRTLVARDDIGLVDVSTTGNTHHEIVLAALAAGQARPLREAARQHPRRGAGDARRGHGGRGRHRHDGQLQLPPGAGGRSSPSS